MKVVSKKWMNKLNDEIKMYDHVTPELTVISHTTSFNKAAQYMIIRLSEENIPFKVYNLGAGVKKITTETDKCPCCKRKL